MPKIELQAKNSKMLKKVKKIVEGTDIIQRQIELTHGHWDFVVMGPNKNNLVIRKGYAQHVKVLDSSAYVVTVVNPSNYLDCSHRNTIPIEEFISGDIPEDLKGLDVLNVDPIRPLSIVLKKTLPLSKGEKMVQDDYSNKNIAIIQTPDEEYWAISVFKYLNECDQYFPDALNEAIRKGQLPINAKFTGHLPFQNKRSHFH